MVVEAKDIDTLVVILSRLRPLQILCKPPVWYRIEKPSRRN